MEEFTRHRSHFSLKIYDNTDNITLTAKPITYKLISSLFPDFESQSPIGWKKSDNYKNVYNLWIPNDRLIKNSLDKIRSWAKSANRFLWLSTNKNTKALFSGDEVDYVLAPDWNFNSNGNEHAEDPDPESDEFARTELGEAEYQLKYHYQALDENIRNRYMELLLDAITECIEFLPIDRQNCVVTAIPATEQGQEKLAWNLAKMAAQRMNLPFCGITLMQERKKAKNMSVEEKVQLWRDIYQNPDSLSVPDDFRGKDVLIIDDLYQSGATVWTMAEYLKRNGAHLVTSVSAVKALRDGDNT